MKITLLGTGTSQGIPVIGCACEACVSDDVRDDRLRSGVAIQSGDTNVIIDTGPDLRQQMLKLGIRHLDGILYTHEHNDHVAGLDDIRPFNFMQERDMPFYGHPRVLAEIKERFAYVFKENPYPGAPSATLNEISAGQEFSIGGLDIRAIDVMHGQLPILGYRFGDFSFITDASFLSEESMAHLAGSEVVVISALRREKHHSHYTLGEAIEVIHKLKPRAAYLTHISHKMGVTKEWEKELPENIFPAYDGLEILM